MPFLISPWEWCHRQSEICAISFQPQRGSSQISQHGPVGITKYGGHPSPTTQSACHPGRAVGITRITAQLRSIFLLLGMVENDMETGKGRSFMLDFLNCARAAANERFQERATQLALANACTYVWGFCQHVEPARE
ncbi:hypothetical protein CEXT_82611 [Caerostris extrusa]|uniref:Uncharacterized protein n=1 Tax=Caerostris extrusa TaxID=172846 RepID=A0AAV4M484_CAEEX|nr:hypothetical protein CEXT_82611 [Caerostris extrusa]